MLTQIQIQNFRLCHDVLIDEVGSIIALVGRNGAGKSNILQAIKLTAKIATSTDAVDYSEILNPTSIPTISLDFKLDSGVFRYALSIEISSTPPPPRPRIVESLKKREGDTWTDRIHRTGDTVAISGRDPIKIGEASPCLTAIATLLPATDETVLLVRPVIEFLSAIHYYPLDESANVGDQGDRFQLIAKKEYAKWLTTSQLTGSFGDSTESILLRILHMFLTDKENFEALMQLVGRNSLGLVDNIRVVNYGNMALGPHGAGQQEVDEYYGVWFSPSRGLPIGQDLFLAYAALSIGTRRIIRMFSVMLCDHSSVLLIEQPEDSLHQGLTKKVMGLLRQNAQPSQLIMSSHSSALLNKLKPEEIRVVSLDNGYTSIRKLSPSDLKKAEDFMSREGPLYSFLESIEEN